jgi:ribonuclease E
MENSNASIGKPPRKPRTKKDPTDTEVDPVAKPKPKPKAKAEAKPEPKKEKKLVKEPKPKKERKPMTDAQKDALKKGQEALAKKRAEKKEVKKP